ncbi:MAG: hypothetical protein ACKOXX_06005 [Actinomycetota bacterium]
MTLLPDNDAPRLQLLEAAAIDPSIKVSLSATGSDYNKPVTWQQEGFGDFCWKIEPFSSSDYRYTLPLPSNPPDSRLRGSPYSAVIVKAGSIRDSDPDFQVNTVFLAPSGGSDVFADVNRNGISDPGGQGGGLLGDKSISHIILCVGASDYEEISSTTTTITPATDGVTTTSVAATQQNACPVPTESTTTTVGGVSSTSVVGGVTTTVGGVSSTSVVGGVTTTVVPKERLPLTFDVTPPKSQDGPKKVEIYAVISSGSEMERLLLSVDLETFEVKPVWAPTTLEALPETGSMRWTASEKVGWWFVIAGLTAFVYLLRPRRRRSEKSES